MTCDTRQAYLRLADQSGTQTRLLEMKPRGKPGRWGLTVTLKPGTYRYRYYAHDGRTTTYVSPCDVDDAVNPMERLDAVPSGAAGAGEPCELQREG